MLFNNITYLVLLNIARTDMSIELFETRVANGQSHKYDFLTVVSMGHCSSIALGIAINKRDQRI